MNRFINDLSKEDKKRVQKISKPEWMSPMLAVLTSERFSNPEWIYECKYDGVRALTFFQKQDVKIYSRNQHNLNKTYPDLLGALQNQSEDRFILDGEIVAFHKGVTSFSKLQQRLGIREISLKEALKSPVYYYVFDILYLNGYDLRMLPLKLRREILEKTIFFNDPVRFSNGINKEGEKYYKEACKKGWEGIIAKRLDASYQGKRSRDWLKFKCHKSQELIIIGYTSPKGQRSHFGALLVGYYKGKDLQYAGKVGTGFSENTLTSLKRKMDQYISPKSLLKENIGDQRVITWLKPKLVGEFDFTEWTRDGKLRHPRFKGLRDDKKAKEVIREEPK